MGRQRIVSARQARFHERLHTPPVGIRAPHPGSCYGSCCGHYVRGGELCTVCRKLYSPTRRTHKYLSGTRTHCCGYHTVTVSPRIQVPRAGAEGRWRAFAVLAGSSNWYQQRGRAEKAMRDYIVAAHGAGEEKTATMTELVRDLFALANRTANLSSKEKKVVARARRFLGGK